MAFPSDAQLAKQRREEERQREREEEARRAELERRQEEQRERDREEQRRQEALRQAQEFEAADEAERQRREAFRSRVREQLRAERRSAARERVRRDAVTEALRAANRQDRQDDEKKAARDEERRGELQQQAARGRRQDEQRDQRQGEERDRRQSDDRTRRQAQERADESVAASRAESRDERRREQAADARDQARAGERLDAQREEARQARRDEQQQDRRAEDEATGRRAAAARAQQDARRETERDAERSEGRREAADQLRRDERQRADAAEARRQSARDARLAERRDAERTSEQAGERAAERLSARTKQTRAAEREEPKQKAAPAAPARDALQARIPSGVLSGALPWLVVEGNRIVNLDAQPVVLRGISVTGMDGAPPDPERGFAAGAGITESTIDAILGWGANVVRVSINRQRVLNGSGTWSAAHYLQDLDWIVRRAAEGGAYTILSLRRLDESTMFGTLPSSASGRTPNFIAPQPDYDTVGMWRLLGARYSDEPAVLFDLYTSPHPALADDLTGFDTDWDLWTLWVRLIVAELRRLHPRALCFVSGLNWATDLSGFPVIGTEGEPVPNLVYGAHCAPRMESPLIAMRALGRSHPLFVTEWGAQTEISWCERIALVLRDEGVGWTAAHWNEEPLLARTAGRQTSPTPFGLVVRRALTLSGRRIGRIA